MSDKRRGLGRGLGALIPSSASASASGNGAAPSRPVDLFFPEARKTAEPVPAVEPDRTEFDEAGTKDASDEVNPAAAKSTAKTAASRGGASGAGAGAVKKAGAAKAAKDSEKSEDIRPDTSPADEPKNEAASAQAAADGAKVDSGAVSDNGVDLIEVPGVRFAEIPVTDIHPNRKQPRSVFDEDDMAELVHSVREIGVLQPIVVRTSTEKGGEPYELVMGERRWRAVQAAGLSTIPAIVRDTTDDDLLRDALLENLHRSQLNPLEEAAAYQQLLEDFGTTHEQLADRIGRSRPQVSNTLRLLKLPPWCSVVLPPMCCLPATPGPCSRFPTQRPWNAWRRRLWLKACRSAPPRKRSPCTVNLRRRRRTTFPARAHATNGWITLPPRSRTGWTPT
jgi:ParB family chromosome partitioning protein